MAIHWTERDRKTNEITKQYTSHVGLTIKRITVVERVMSDIYSDEAYAIVWNPETKEDERKKVGSAFELFCGPYGTVTPDLLPEYKQERDAIIKKREEEQRKRELERIEKDRINRAKQQHNRPQKGMTMKVIRGRKTPQGTTGIVFWLDDITNPSRVGLALDDEKDDKGRYKNVAWVNAEYLENTEPFVDPKIEQDTRRKKQKDLYERTTQQLLKIALDAKKDGLSLQKIEEALDETIEVINMLEKDQQRKQTKEQQKGRSQKEKISTPIPNAPF